MFKFLKKMISGKSGNQEKFDAQTTKKREGAQKTKTNFEITDDDRLSGRLEFEYEMGQLKPERQIRLVGKPEFAFTKLMELSGVNVAQLSNVLSYVVIQDWNGTTSHIIEDYSAYSIFQDLVQSQSGGKYTPYGLSRSVTLCLQYDDPEGQKGFFCAYCSMTGASNKDLHLMSRVAIFHKIPNKPQAYTNKVMITFDDNDAQPWREKLVEIQQEAHRKLQEGLPLNQDEEAVTGGSLQISYLMAEGDQKGESLAWSGAIYYYLQVYRLLHRGVYNETAPELALQQLINVSYKLGVCYYHKGFYVKAKYYLVLASAGSEDPRIETLIKECDEQMKFLKNPDKAEVEKKMMSRLMFMLHFCFDIAPQEISSLYWLAPAEQKEGLIENSEEISDFDIRSAMRNHEELVLQLSYRTSSFVFDRDNTYDKSQLQYDSSVVLYLYKVDGVITVIGMVPQFTNCNLESYQQNASLQFCLEDICSQSDFESIQSEAQQKMKDKAQLYAEEIWALGNQPLAHLYHLNGELAFQHHIFGDALYNEYIAQTLLFSDNGNESDLFDALAWRDSIYNIGFTFTQLHHYIPAITYLAYLSGCEVSSYMSEYYNALTLERDIRSRTFLDGEYEQVIRENAYPHLTGEERTQYIAYLKRRRGFVMTDQGHFDKAVPYLTSLLDDPLCADYARKELDYIRKKD